MMLWPGTGSATAGDFLAYLRRDEPPAALIAYNPSRYDPRQPVPAGGYPDDEILADLTALRPGFDGLVLYAFTPGLTDRVVAAALDLGYRALLLGIWDPRSPVETAGVADLVRRFHHRLALAVAIGNEGLNDARYTLDDVARAAAALTAMLPAGVRVPVTTSEPAGDYGWPPLQRFGDFLAPNIHPALDRGDLGPAAAAAWVRGKAQAIACAAGRPVLVKETGVPNGGSDRFSPAGQAAFWGALVAPEAAPGAQRRVRQEPCPPPWTATAHTWVSVAAAFEAFDAPWKAVQMQSPIEGHWGFLAWDRTPYPAFAVFTRRDRAPPP
jgi:exo-beta-1,3-glucanase (GH17 family)